MDSRHTAPRAIFRRTLDALHAAGQNRDVKGLGGLRAKMSFGAWMILRTASYSQAEGFRLRAVSRLLFWQLWRRLPGAGAIAGLPRGEQLLCPPWSHLAGAWVSVGDHERELHFVRSILRPGDLFIDVGANLGAYTVVAAARGTRVLAFEPNPKARAMLEENVALNSVGKQVEIVSHALADFTGSASFTSDLEECNHLEMQSAAAAQRVEVRELDSFLETRGPATLIKIDVEGFDEAVLRGARNSLRRDRPILIVETWAGAHGIRTFLTSFGYSFFLYDRWLRPLAPDFSEDGNLIAIPAERVEWAQERLGTSERSDRRPSPRWVMRREWRRG